MNRGCVIFAFALVVVIAIAGFFAYRAFRQSLEVPQEYAAFTDRDSLRARIESQTPAPSDSTPLTAEDIRLFVGAIEPINAGWKPLEKKFDSLGLNFGKKKGSNLNLLAMPELLHEIAVVGPRIRKELVGYLNRSGLSLDRYLWLKEHVVAASGITRGEIDSAIDTRMTAYFGGDHDTVKGSAGGDKDFDRFFDRVDAIRAAGLVDSAETALVRPYRPRLMEDGLPCLIGVENNYTFKVD